MTPEMRTGIIDAAVNELRAMLEENMSGIEKTMSIAHENHADPLKPFKYPVSMGIVLQPVGEACKVTAKISYSVSQKDESFGETVDPNQVKMNFDE